MSKKVATADLAIAKLAARQHGVVSIQQLRAAGLDHDAVSYRVRVGRLHRLHRGVYAVGHDGTTSARRWMAGHQSLRNPGDEPAKTIADLRGCVSSWELRQAIRQAEVSGLPLGVEISTDRTRSDLERDFPPPLPP